jgi:post-segregation antitoxin (ccd killing protein)
VPPRLRVTPRLPDGDPQPSLRGLDLSAVAEDAIGRAYAQLASERFAAEVGISVAQHDAYLAEYGSLADAVRLATEPGG